MSEHDHSTSETTAWAPASLEAGKLLELARAERPAPSAVEQQGEQRFLSAFREHHETQKRKSRFQLPAVVRYGLVAAAAFSLALGAHHLGWLSGEQALSYQVSSGQAAELDRVIQVTEAPVNLSFSDGTLVQVQRGSARVSATSSRGAHFVLTSGKMAFNVVPHAVPGDWVIAAGPFQVRVTGTAFTVEWDQVSKAFEVAVTRGHVVVEGAGDKRELGPGDSFQHHEPDQVTSVTVPSAPSAPSAPNDRASAPSTSPSELGTEAPSNAAPLSTGVPAPSASAAEKSKSWAQLVTAGDFATVIELAERRGVPSCLDSCSQDDLRALADAGRLAGKSSLAEKVFRAQRARFAGSPDAVAAAFLLGRMAEDRHEGRAIDWYDAYLKEAPAGRFASDALGRKMMLMASVSRPSAAALAQQYLDRFPGGSYATHARGLLKTSGSEH